MKTYYVKKGKLREALDILEILKKVKKKREERAGG
jgi:hypothetical protein